MQTTTQPPSLEQLLVPLLATLPSAAVSPQPPAVLLPLLSPILRQRVQLLSSADGDPWLPLLCYDAAKVPGLVKVAKDESLEPHPVSGEVEVDWEAQVETKYRRLDEETLQALVTLQDLGLSVKLVWCVNDEAGGGDGWKIGEVGVTDKTNTPWGEPSILTAESAFRTLTAEEPITHLNANSISLHTPAEDEDEDDDYWAQYDKTPGHTPAPKASPAPAARLDSADEDSYYAQYATVQPAMDNHDPDEAKQNGDVETSLGRDEITRELQSSLSPQNPDFGEPQAPWSEDPHYINGIHNGNGNGEANGLAHPRPSSSQSSSGSDTVARLEKRAAQNSARDQSEIGIKQHISSSMKSLYRLAKVGGIDRDEFERLIRTELECLALMDEDDM
ncbi:hypothetical protein OIDMADRAFT_167688 [Oidiodendron maius Zn]|uniref:Uncharacterized protein n=1 Tax=Oidiodendron maius (strain Zn) TaxID=913774 RepID=A0A0C3H2R0_OIDMZ|nr:hypothetical protein OIDMADRAFT_167688 [Oidiodendron maius Zn]